MKKTKKALASLAIAGMVLTMVPFNAFANATISTRLAGTTAAQTAVAIADQTGWTGTAILASSASYGMVDALTSGPLAKLLSAPILLQEPGAVLNADTKAELTKLAVKKVYVTSGTAVINQAVLDELTGMGITVVSLGGVDRFETSVNIAKEMVKLGATVSNVAVAYGWLNQDALSIASIASASTSPILLTEKDAVPASVTAFLAANTSVVSSDVIGGTGVISEAVKTALPNATRHYGVTAYDTNNQVIKDFASSLSFDNVFVANGITAIDALAGAPLAATYKSAIVLTDGTVPAAATFVNSKLTSTSVVTALGGTAVVPASVLAGIVSVVPAVLEVTSVSAINLKQVVVTFNTDVTDNDEVEDVDNYTFEGVAIGTDDADAIDVVDVDVNGKVVTLTLKDAVENQTEGTLTVDENVVGADAEFASIKFFDTTIPTVSGAEVVGNDTIKVNFSEPINFGVLDANGFASSDVEDAFSLNDGEFFVKSVKPMNNNTEANVEFYTKLESADYTISVGNDLEDYAGFNVVPKDVELTVVEDTTAPKIVSYKDVTPTKITLVFDGDIEPADGAASLTPADFFHTNTKNPAKTAVIVNGNEIDLTFDEDYELPNGTAYVYVEDEAIQDLWDNVNEARLSISVNVVVDAAAPKVSDIEVTTQDEITLTFNEELDKVSAEKEANYTLLDADGDEVNITNAKLQANDDGDLVEVKLSLGDKIYGDLTLTVEDVEDVAGNAMSAQKLDFNAADETAPLFSDFKATLYSVDADIYTVVVDFDEAMSVEGQYSVLDLAKYQIGTVNLADVDSSNIKIAATDSNTKVKIELEKVNEYGDTGINLAVASTDILTLGRVADAAGNYTAQLVSAAAGVDAIAIDAASTVSVDKVEAIDNNKIAVTLDGKVTDFEANDFIVETSAGVDLVSAGARIDNSGTDSVITITLDDVNELTDAATLGTAALRVVTASTAIGTENSYGEAVEILSTDANGVVQDKIAPELAVYTNVPLDLDEVDDVAYGAGKVVLTFSEAINPLTVSKYSFEVQDATVVTAVLSDGNKVITLNVTSTGTDQEAPALGTSVTQKNPIYDIAGNTITGVSTDVQYFDQAGADADAALALTNAKTAATTAIGAAVTSETAYTTALGSNGDAVYTDVTAADAILDTAVTSNVTADIIAATTALNTKVTALNAATDVLVAAADVAAVADAKVEVVAGTVTVATGADAATKLAAVQTYVNGLITNDVVAVVTANATPGDYDVALTQNDASDSKTISMTITESL